MLNETVPLQLVRFETKTVTGGKNYYNPRILNGKTNKTTAVVLMKYTKLYICIPFPRDLIKALSN